MKKSSEEDYKNKCKELNVEYVGTHKEFHKGNMVDYICPKHKNIGIQTTDWSHFKIQKNSCPYCAGRYRTTEDAQRLIKNPNIIFLSNFDGDEKPITCKCLKCNYIWINNRPMDLFRRENGCPICSRKDSTEKRTLSQDDYESKLYKVNPYIKIIGKYKGTHKLIKCKCLKDDYIWESYACNLLNGSASCPKCNMSVGENKIIEFMEKNNINYSRQKKFDDCKDKYLLKFDIYDEDHNILIEFQGEQHYFPVDFETNNPEKANIQFETLQKRDKIKSDFCKKNSIPLICIPYYERNNVEKFLINNSEVYKQYA